MGEAMDPKLGTQSWEPKLGTKAGNQSWEPKLRTKAGNQSWDRNVAQMNLNLMSIQSESDWIVMQVEI